MFLVSSCIVLILIKSEILCLAKPNVEVQDIVENNVAEFPFVGNKNTLVGNALNIGQLRSKSPDLQSPSNLQGAMGGNICVAWMVNSMTISNNGTQTMGFCCLVLFLSILLFKILFSVMNSIAQGNVRNMILTNSNMGYIAGAMASGLESNNLKQQIGAGPIMCPGVQTGQTNTALYHGGHQPGMQNGPIINLVGGPHIMGNGPRMQTHKIPLGQLNSMGVSNGPYGYGGPNQQGVNIVNAGSGSQHSMLVNTISQQRVPSNIVMQGNRPGVPIGTNIGLDGVGYESGIVGQTQPQNQSPAHFQAGAPTGAQLRPQTIPQKNPNNMQSQQNPGTAQKPPNQPVVQDKKKQIQQQLMLLLHAHKCARPENEISNNSPKCAISYCKTMKDVLSHMVNCKANKDCTVPHCISSRQILLNWKNCNRPDCGVCLPLRQTDKFRSSGSNINAIIASSGAQVGGNVNMANITVVGAGSPATLNAKQDQDMSKLQNQNQEMRTFDGLGMQGPVSSASNILPRNSPASQALVMRMSAPSVRILDPNQGVPQNSNQVLPNNILMGSDMNAGNSDLLILGGSSHVVSISDQHNSQQHGISSQKQSFAGQQNQQQTQVQQQTNNPQSVNIQMFNPNNGDGPTKVVTSNQFSQMKMGILPTSQLSGVSTSGTTKDWHHSVTTDLRNHLVNKLVQVIFPTSDPATMMDKRLHNLVSYAEKVERDIYEMSNSRSEYYHRIAEKIYKIEKDLEEKRQKRKDQQLVLQQHQQQQLQPASPSPQSISGQQQMRPVRSSGMVSPMTNQEVGPSNTMGSMMQSVSSPGLIGRGAKSISMRNKAESSFSP